MAIRRLLAVSLALAVSPALSVESLPAEAATGTTYVVHGVAVRNQVPGSLDTDFSRCDAPGPEPHATANTMVNTSAGSPLGNAFWAVDEQQTDIANGPSQGYDHVSDFSSASLDVLNQNESSSGGAQGARAYAYVRDSDGTIWSGLADAGQVTVGSGWQTVSVDASTVFTWLHYSQSALDNQPPLSDAPFTGTIAELEAQETGDVGGRVGISMGCGGGEYGFDAATFGQGDSAITYDLETSGSTVIDGGPTSFLIPGGGADSVQCGLFDGDGSTWYEEGDLTLEARPAGSQAWHAVGTATQQITLGINGIPERVEFAIAPTLNTEYRCTYAGTYPSSSSPEPVLVYDRITASPRSVRVARGKNIVILGQVIPATPGRKVTLYAGGQAVAHTKLDATGHYRLVTPARHAGSEMFAVLTATTRKHIGSVSAPFVVRVVRR